MLGALGPTERVKIKSVASKRGQWGALVLNSSCDFSQDNGSRSSSAAGPSFVEENVIVCTAVLVEAFDCTGRRAFTRYEAWSLIGPTNVGMPNTVCEETEVWRTCEEG